MYVCSANLQRHLFVSKGFSTEAKNFLSELLAKQKKSFSRRCTQKIHFIIGFVSTIVSARKKKPFPTHPPLCCWSRPHTPAATCHSLIAPPTFFAPQPWAFHTVQVFHSWYVYVRIWGAGRRGRER
jgi:hypothetical protein